MSRKAVARNLLGILQEVESRLQEERVAVQGISSRLALQGGGASGARLASSPLSFSGRGEWWGLERAGPAPSPSLLLQRRGRAGCGDWDWGSSGHGGSSCPGEHRAPHISLAHLRPLALQRRLHVERPSWIPMARLLNRKVMQGSASDPSCERGSTSLASSVPEHGHLWQGDPAAGARKSVSLESHLVAAEVLPRRARTPGADSSRGRTSPTASPHKLLELHRNERAMEEGDALEAQAGTLPLPLTASMESLGPELPRAPAPSPAAPPLERYVELADEQVPVVVPREVREQPQPATWLVDAVHLLKEYYLKRAGLCLDSYSPDPTYPMTLTRDVGIGDGQVHPPSRSVATEPCQRADAAVGVSTPPRVARSTQTLPVVCEPVNKCGHFHWVASEVLKPDLAFYVSPFSEDNDDFLGAPSSRRQNAVDTKKRPSKNRT